MSERKKRIVIIGATSAIAEHCARLWIMEAAADFVLVGRDIDKTELVAADLQVRSSKSTVTSLQADFIDPHAIQEIVTRIIKDGPVDIVLIAHGVLPEQQKCQADLTLCQEALIVNGVSPVLFAEAFARHMEEANSGVLAIIGSVAGDRGRKSNYVYGAAKGLITRYAQGMQHRFASTNVRVVLIKPGPTFTPMTAHLQNHVSQLAKVEDVAQAIVAGIEKRRAVVYAPTKWALIMMVIRHLPQVIFNRMSI